VTILDHTRVLPLLAPAGWEERSACDATTSELFFAVGHDWTSPANKARIAQAKAICAGCPVIAECKASAIARDDQWAIAGGLTPDERHGRR
jgi:WhiB family redox-sensing transcriptional regulator